MDGCNAQAMDGGWDRCAGPVSTGLCGVHVIQGHKLGEKMEGLRQNLCLWDERRKAKREFV